MSQEVMNTLVDMSQEIIKLKDQKWELLTALKLCQKQLQGLSFKATQIVEALERTQAAISKAEGEKA